MAAEYQEIPLPDQSQKFRKNELELNTATNAIEVQAVDPKITGSKPAAAVDRIDS